jgi:hypothetical protein
MTELENTREQNTQKLERKTEKKSTITEILIFYCHELIE